MPSDRQEALRWAAYAEDDWNYALLGMARYPRNAGWDFHQSAEKYLKAALLELGTEPPRTHDLLRFLNLLAPDLNASSPEVEAASNLTLFGVVRRYPGDLPEVSEQEVEQARNHALTLRTSARTRLALD